MTRTKFLAVFVVLVGAASPAVQADVRRDIEYARAEGESLKLDVSVPEGDGPFPVAILVHGGGWGGGDKEKLYVPPTQPLEDAKFTWFSINYRLAPQFRWPAGIDDVRTAIRWVKAHAAEFKGDPSRIVLIGYSAGGHLAAFAVATAEDDTRVQAVVVMAGPTDLIADSERRGGLSKSLQALFDRQPTIDEEARGILRAASPITKVTANSPPCLLIHGPDDLSVDYRQSESYKARLDKLGVPCEFITIPGGTHDIRAWEKLAPDYQAQMIQWLRKTVVDKPAAATK